MAVVKGSLLGRLQSEFPNQSLLSAAIDKLTMREEIVQFFGEYVEWLARAGYGEHVARGNIGYMLGLYNKEVERRWRNAIPGIFHPYAGA